MFREPTADGGRLLQTVAAEAAREQQVRNPRDWADKGILIECIVVIVPCPSGRDAYRFERRNAMREYRPRLVFEHGMIDLEVVRGHVRVGVGHRPAQESVALR